MAYVGGPLTGPLVWTTERTAWEFPKRGPSWVPPPEGRFVRDLLSVDGVTVWWGNKKAENENVWTWEPKPPWYDIKVSDCPPPTPPTSRRTLTDISADIRRLVMGHGESDGAAYDKTPYDR